MKKLLIFVLLSLTGLGAIPANYPEIASNTFAPKTNPTFTGTVILGTNGIVFSDGKTQITAPKPLVKTVVTTRFLNYGTQTPGSGDNGTNSQYAFSMTEKLTLPVNCYGVTPYYIGYYQYNTPTPGWTYSNGFENGLPNALEIACSIIDSTGRLYPQTFYGNRIGRLNPFGYLQADSNLQQYNAGDYVVANVYANRLLSNTNTYNNGEIGVLNATGAYIPLFNGNPADNKSGYTVVRDYASGLNTLESKIDTNNAIFSNSPFSPIGFPPFAYVGYVAPSDLNSVVGIGDSIEAGVGDTANLGDYNAGNGYMARALRSTKPFLNLGIGGDKAQSWAVTNGTSRTTYRIRLMNELGFRWAYIAMGYNDSAAGNRTFDQLTNDYANLCKVVYDATGAKILAATVTTGQSSVSGKYFGSGDLSVQYTNQATVVPLFNTLLRTNPSAISPYITSVLDVASWWGPDGGPGKYLTNALYNGTVTTTNSSTFLNVYWRTLIDTNANWATNQWLNCPVQITNSVSPSWPANAMVFSNNATTLYLTYPPGVNVTLVTTNYLTAGATYSIGNGSYTVDGSHPAPWIHGLFATNIINLNPFK